MAEKTRLSQDITSKDKRTTRLSDQLRANLKRRKAARGGDVAVQPPEVDPPVAVPPEAAKIPAEKRS